MPPAGRYGQDLFDSLGAYALLPDDVHASLHRVRLEYHPGPAGYLRWYLDGALGFEVLNSSLGAYPERQARLTDQDSSDDTENSDGGDTGTGAGTGTAEEQLPPRLVPEEPMYLIISASRVPGPGLRVRAA